MTEDTLFTDFAVAASPAARVSSRGIGSSGLGLPICARLARLLGGSMHVIDRSFVEPGAHGVSFELALPVHAVNGAVVSQRVATASAAMSGFEAEVPLG